MLSETITPAMSETNQIAWQQIDTVLLDMDGTLLDLHFDTYFWLQHLRQIYAQENGLQLADAHAMLAPLFKRHAGTLNWYDVNFWSDTLKIDIMSEKHRVADRIAYLPGAEDFLSECRQHVSDLRLITNGHRKVLDLKISRTGLDQYFDVMLCSHELGAAKEHLSFWHKLQARQQFDRQRTVFIDDSESVLDAASQFGIKHIFCVETPDSQTPRHTPSKYPMLKNLCDGFNAALLA